jgi:hypothetical protein
MSLSYSAELCIYYKFRALLNLNKLGNVRIEEQL